MAGWLYPPTPDAATKAADRQDDQQLRDLPRPSACYHESRARGYSPDLVVLAFLSRNDVSDNHPGLDSNPMRPYYVLDGDSLVLDDGFLERDAYQRRQAASWKLAVGVSNHSRIIQLMNEVCNRRKAAARARSSREKA